MKKKDFIWFFASIVLSAAVALLIFLPRSTKGSDDILAPDIAESSEEIPVFTGQDSGDIPAESVLGKNVQTTGGEKAGIETDLRAISRLCRADYLQAEKNPSAYAGQENIGHEDVDAMEAAFKEFSQKALRKEERPSVLDQLRKFKELVAALPGKVINREKKRELDR